MLLIFYGIFDFTLLDADIFTLIFLTIYIFMIGFFMMNLITATYVDEYRLAYLDHGFA